MNPDVRVEPEWPDWMTWITDSSQPLVLDRTAGTRHPSGPRSESIDPDVQIGSDLLAPRWIAAAAERVALLDPTQASPDEVVTAPETHALPYGPLMCATMAEIVVDLDTARGSAEMFIPLAPAKPVDSHPSLAEEVDTRISRDLLDKLVLPRVQGKDYAGDAVEGQAEAAAAQGRLWEDEDISPSEKSPRGLRKCWSEDPERGAGWRKTPSFWDLLFPILVAPLDLGDTQFLSLPFPLYPFQIQGVNFLLENPHALLADDMGTGKTVMTAVALRIMFQKGEVSRALVVCPRSVRGVWDDHLRDWAPNLRVTVVDGARAVRQIDWSCPAHVYVVTYQTLRNDLEQIQAGSFDIVVLDEAQNIKNPDAAQSRAVRKLHSGRRWALTGTPVENRVDDILALFRFIKPGLMPAPPLEPHEVMRLVRPYFLRRRKEQVFSELPPKSRQELWFDLTESQRVAYDEALSRGRAQISADGLNTARIHIFALLRKLMQICNFAPRDSNGEKVERLCEQVAEIADSGRKILIFTQFIGEGLTKICGRLDESRIKWVSLSGSMTDREREEALHRFRNEADVTALVAAIKTGGVGITLTEATYVIHFDHWWNPAVMWQAEDRAHRHGQKEPVTVYSYWCRGTIEERIHQKLREKGLLYEQMVNGMAEEDIEELISTEEWLEMLGLKGAQPDEAHEPPQVGEQIPAEGDFEATLKRLLELDPRGFEEFVARFLRALGYANARTRRHTADGGIDVEASRQGPEGIERVIAQCKRYTGTVAVDVARELLGVLTDQNDVSKAFLVTTGLASRECRRFCRRNARLVLIEGPKLASYVSQWHVPVEANA